MSQYLSFTFRNKDGVEFSETGYSTTPARELSENGVFPYACFKVEVTRDLLREYIQISGERVFELFEECERYRHKLAELHEMISSCTSKEVYNEIKNDIEQTSAMMSATEDEKREWEGYRRHFMHLADLMEENKDWKLYYINC